MLVQIFIKSRVIYCYRFWWAIQTKLNFHCPHFCQYIRPTSHNSSQFNYLWNSGQRNFGKVFDTSKLDMVFFVVRVKNEKSQQLSRLGRRPKNLLIMYNRWRVAWARVLISLRFRATSGRNHSMASRWWKTIPSSTRMGHSLLGIVLWPLIARSFDESLIVADDGILFAIKMS